MTTTTLDLVRDHAAGWHYGRDRAGCPVCDYRARIGADMPEWRMRALADTATRGYVAASAIGRGTAL